MPFKEKKKIFTGLLQLSLGKTCIRICKDNASQSLHAPFSRVTVISAVPLIISQLALTSFHQQMYIKKLHWFQEFYALFHFFLKAE